MEYWRYECGLCDWVLVVPIPMLEYRSVVNIVHILLGSHADVHADEVVAEAEALLR